MSIKSWIPLCALGSKRHVSRFYKWKHAVIQSLNNPSWWKGLQNHISSTLQNLYSALGWLSYLRNPSHTSDTSLLNHRVSYQIMPFGVPLALENAAQQGLPRPRAAADSLLGAIVTNQMIQLSTKLQRCQESSNNTLVRVLQQPQKVTNKKFTKKYARGRLWPLKCSLRVLKWFFDLSAGSREPTRKSQIWRPTTLQFKKFTGLSTVEAQDRRPKQQETFN